MNRIDPETAPATGAPVVVFDLDGTLLDTAHDLIGAVNRVMAEEGLPPIEVDPHRVTVGRGGRAMVAAALAAAEVPHDEERLDRLTLRFVELYMDNVADRTVPFPNVEAALDRLAAAGIVLAVCTNKRVGLAEALFAAIGWTDRFAAVCGGDSFDVRKPEPGHILLTIAAAGGDPAAAVMVGDSAADIDAARAAGIPVVGVTFGYTPTPVRDLGPDAVIDDFADLWPALLEIAPPALAARLGATDETAPIGA
ncbi:phosphoglycolate phosphatase [Methylobrevis albus]|uniref:Phosphoglycolate phosphatase n=1 Tax=Methylobrevis albus TaxID=2793297 RepID=A0A931I088_9HYPH|nr:phosphoglycolate phosphatase [Methylobrevis albus]MBH0236593.1 phosphoglycolate phosphatase [Methylobrevis albus]